MGATLTRPRLDRSTVVAAARELLDDEGFDSFSMARLGQRLGVTGMALYRHVADRADLEAAVAASVLEDLTVEPISGVDWVDGVAGWMRGVRDHWRRHRWLGRLLGTEARPSPPWFAALEHLQSLLERGGLPPEAVARELVRISRTTAGIVVLENAAPLPVAGGFPGPIAEHLVRYGNDDLFDDVVSETTARLRAWKGEHPCTTS